MLVCDVNSPDATTNRNQLNKKTLILYILNAHKTIIENITNIPPFTTNKYAHNIGSFIQRVSLNQNIWFTFASYWVVRC